MMRHLNAGIWNSFANPIATNSQESTSTYRSDQRLHRPYRTTGPRRLAAVSHHVHVQATARQQIAIINQMTDEIERVYATLVTRVVRKPRSPKSADRLPVFVGFADLPVAKRERKQLREVTLNDGLHYHGILLMPGRSRLRNGRRVSFHEVSPPVPPGQVAARSASRPPNRYGSWLCCAVRAQGARERPAVVRRLRPRIA